MSVAGINFLAFAVALGLFGIYPVAYLAYRNFASQTHQERLKDDFRLLGLVREADLDSTVHELYRTVYNPVQFLAYICLILLVSILLLTGYLNRNELGVIPPEVVEVMAYSFLGAYVYSIQELVRRYNTFDLQPQVYSSILVRLLVASFITFAGATVIQYSGGSLAAVADDGQVVGPTWAAVLAFVIGIFPNSGLRWFSQEANRILKFDNDEINAVAIKNIKGVSTWHEARLAEMGIDDAQNLATVDMRRILLTTQFDTHEVIHWIDQAILFTKVGANYERYKAVNITSFHELRMRLNRLSLNDPLAQRDAAQVAAVEEERRTLAAALGLSGPEALDSLADATNYPNYNFIAEYYLRTSAVARQRAAEGMQILQGASEEKDFVRAIQEYERRARHSPNDARIYTNLGSARYALGQYDQAVAAFDRALALDAGLAEAYSNRARANLMLGKYEQVLRDCMQAIRLDNLNKFTFNYRGMAYTHLGDWQKALSDFNRVLDLDDRFADAYLNRGLIYNAYGQFENARKDFERYHLLGDRNNFELWLGWGTSLLGLSQWDDAIQRLTQAVLYEHPKLAAAYARRGYAYLQLQDSSYYDEARSDLNAAIQRDPAMLEAYDNLGLLEIRLNRPDAAVSHYLKALEQAPERYTTRYNLALAYYRLNQIDGAVEQFEAIIKVAPENSFEAKEAGKWLQTLSTNPAPQPSERPANDSQEEEK